MAPNGQSAPIAVYGATGYTGRLVAAELRRRGADCVLAGRSAAKLEIVAEDLGGDIATAAVALDDPTGLRALLEPCAAVIACAGPFERHGEPVLRAALESGTHYLDTTGEQTFMRRVFDEYGRAAAEAGVALVTAMGFDYAPGDMLAALTTEAMGPLDEIVIAYDVTGWDVIGLRASRGTALSTLGILAGGDVEWRDGELVPAPQGVGRGTFEFPPPLGRQRMIRYPSGEHLTVPRHVEAACVRTMLTARTAMPHPRLAMAAPLVMSPLQVATRTPLRRALGLAVARLPEGPSEQARRRARFTVVCDARRGERRRRGSLSGSDVYGTTARLAVHGALACATPGFERTGALAQSEAFDPRETLRALGIAYEVIPA